MSLLLNIGILLAITAAMVILIAVIIVKYREEKKEKDNPFIINFLAGHCEGRAIGVQTSVIEGKNGRKIIKFQPKDVTNDDLIEIPEVEAIVEPNKIIHFPKGDWSKDKNIEWLLPSTPDKFPDAIKQHEFGKMLMFWTALKNADNALIESLREGMKRQSTHLVNLGGGEASIQQITQLNEIFQDALSAVKDSKKDKPNPYSPPSFGGHPPGP